jgi:hypothetical protein
LQDSSKKQWLRKVFDERAKAGDAYNLQRGFDERNGCLFNLADIKVSLVRPFGVDGH